MKQLSSNPSAAFDFSRAAEIDAQIGRGARVYDLAEAFARASDRKGPVGLVAEFSGEIGRGFHPSGAGGFYLPASLLTGSRDLSATIGGSGAVTVQTSVLPTAPLLRPHSRIVALGGTVMNGLSANLSLPLITSGSSLLWLPEGISPPATPEPVFGYSVILPSRAVGYIVASRQLLAQGRGAEETILNDLRAAAGEAIDRAAVAGSGMAGEPLGLLSTAGVGEVTFGGAATWAKVLEFEALLASLNADRPPLGWLTDGTVREAWRDTEKFPGSGCSVWTDDNTVAGWAAMTSQTMPPGRVAFGTWSDLVVALWAIEILIDPFFSALGGHVRFVINALVGVGVRRPKSFVISTDSGAQ